MYACRIFFLFIHTRIQPYVDYGGVLVNHFFPSAVPPRYVKHPRAGSVAAPLPPNPPPFHPPFSRFHRPFSRFHRELNQGLEVIRPTLTTTPGAQVPVCLSNALFPQGRNGRTPGGRTTPRHTARTTKTEIECKTNDDVPERGHHHNLRPNFCMTKHGWIGPGDGPVEDFICLVYAPAFAYLFCCFC